MAGFVGATHEFHDAAYVRGWADRFQPTPPRLELFELILANINALPATRPHVVELGIGPGYMARHIVQERDGLSYEGVDFSRPMLDIARGTLGARADRVIFTEADLTNPNWTDRLSRRPDMIISTWSLHDLGSRAAAANVYARSFNALNAGGALINGDFIKPDGTDWQYEPGRFEIGLHLEDLRTAGFAETVCLQVFEPNLIEPTAAQNYACLMGRKGTDRV